MSYRRDFPSTGNPSTWSRRANACIDRPGTVVLVPTPLSAADLNGLLLGGVPPRFLRGLLAEGLTRESWAASAPRDGEDPNWRAIPPRDPGCPTAVLGSAEYPWVLSSLSSPPVLLYYHGPLDRLLPGVGVVGSREVTSIGSSVARLAAQTAVELDAPVISGLAAGVDETAHRSALDAGGFTVGWLAAGLDQVAGRAAALVGDVLDGGGLVVSEVPPGVGFSPATLMARNRLVAASSYPLVIAEAALASGTLAAARDAFSIGVPLLVPEPPASFRTHANAQGLLALAGHSPRSLLRWPSRLLGEGSDPVQVANGVPSNGQELREMLKVCFWLRPRNVGELPTGPRRLPAGSR